MPSSEYEPFEHLGYQDSIDRTGQRKLAALRAAENVDGISSLDPIKQASPALKLKSQLNQTASPKKKVNYVARNKSVVPTIRKNTTER